MPRGLTIPSRRKLARSPSYAALLERLFEGAERSHLECREYGRLSSDSGIHPLLSLSTPTKARAGKKGVLIVAGIHGDEPAGIEAIAEMLHSGLPDPKRFWFALFPCINPTGYEQQTRTATSGLDLNRVFSRDSIAPEVRAIIGALADAPSADRDLFTCAIELHEDNPAEPCDFCHSALPIELPYLYQHLRGDTECLAERIFEALTRTGHRLCAARELYGDLCVNGVISYGERSPNQALVGLLHFANFAVKHLSPRVLTVETPTIGPLTDRISFHRAAVKQMLSLL